MKTTAAILAMLMTLLASTPSLSAQEDYRFDAGGGIGMTGYLGDANSANLWSMPSFDAELLFRYIANPRWNFKTNIYIANLRGDSSKLDNIFPDDRTYKFSTTLFEVGEMAEFHFFNYGMGEYYRHLKRFTPYITAGLGAALWSTDGSLRASPVIPVGIGVKYKPSLRLNLGVEFLMKKTFSDRLDSMALDDPMGIKSNFMKNTDWYSTLTFTVSYEFSKRCAACNYKD